MEIIIGFVVVLAGIGLGVALYFRRENQIRERGLARIMSGLQR